MKKQKWNFTMLEPYKHELTNKTFTKPYSMTDSECGSLDVVQIEEQIFSFWKCKSIWYRIKFLFTGKMALSIYGDGMPPVSLFIGEVVKKNG